MQTNDCDSRNHGGWEFTHGREREMNMAHTCRSSPTASLASSASCRLCRVRRGSVQLQDQNTSALYKKILSADYKTPKFISEARSESRCKAAACLIYYVLGPNL